MLRGPSAQAESLVAPSQTPSSLPLPQTRQIAYTVRFEQYRSVPAISRERNIGPHEESRSAPTSTLTVNTMAGRRLRPANSPDLLGIEDDEGPGPVQYICAGPPGPIGHPDLITFSDGGGRPAASKIRCLVDPRLRGARTGPATEPGKALRKRQRLSLRSPAGAGPAPWGCRPGGCCR